MSDGSSQTSSLEKSDDGSPNLDANKSSTKNETENVIVEDCETETAVVETALSLNTEEVSTIVNTEIVEQIQVEEIAAEKNEEKMDNIDNDLSNNEDTCKLGNFIPTEATIHATAIFENSPFPRFSSEEWNSLLRCIVDKEHLHRNIVDVQCCRSSSRELSNQTFKHTVEILIKVKTEGLWESPRSYLWKHLGQEGWTRRNGTSISLTRIHQK